LGDDFDLPAINDQRVAAGRHFAGKPPLDAIVLEQHCQRLRIGQVVDGQYVKFAGPLHHGPQGNSSDSTKTIDSDGNSHDSILPKTIELCFCYVARQILLRRGSPHNQGAGYQLDLIPLQRNSGRPPVRVPTQRRFRKPA